VNGVPPLQHYQWVGKYYERDDDARRVATVLRELAASDCYARGDLVIPSLRAYHAPLRLLLLGYEPGTSVTAALARDHAVVLSAIGRALAALHGATATLARTAAAAAVLESVRQRVADLCARYHGEAVALRQMLTRLERRIPGDPPAPSFLHGDLGPVQLLWQAGRIVFLDFDRCTHGDPALDLGNLLTQLRRLTLRKPGKLPDFATLRRGLLDAYQLWSPTDPDLTERVAWYEQVMLLRKIDFLASDTTRHREAEALRHRQAEAAQLLGKLAALVESE
jgi:aminoglycoside phosphotransferase (APT) family kinase protein